MRVLFTTILLFITVHLLGQTDFRIDTSRKAIDSLFNKLNILAKTIGEHGIGIPEPVEYYKSLVKNYGNDSTAILYFNDGGKLLFRKINRYDKKMCRWWDASEVYDSLGKLLYSEAWKWACLKASNKTDSEVKYLDALLYEKQRFAYDSLGRIIERVWWYAPIGGVRKYNYAYDSNNKQTYILTKLEEALFWK